MKYVPSELRESFIPRFEDVKAPTTEFYRNELIEVFQSMGDWLGDRPMRFVSVGKQHSAEEGSRTIDLMGLPIGISEQEKRRFMLFHTLSGMYVSPIQEKGGRVYPEHYDGAMPYALSGKTNDELITKNYKRVVGAAEQLRRFIIKTYGTEPEPGSKATSKKAITREEMRNMRAMEMPRSEQDARYYFAMNNITRLIFPGPGTRPYFLAMAAAKYGPETARQEFDKLIAAGVRFGSVATAASFEPFSEEDEAS